MSRLPRRELIDEQEVGIYHCVQRAVRRAFLCGRDPVTGKDYEHRKGLIQKRLEFLAGYYGVEVLAFAVMSNHLHVVLRNRPDVAQGWSDDEVARRWWFLFPGRREQDGRPAEPADSDLRMLTADREALAERRRRLSSLSWFMRSLAEPIARLANREDGCTGRFWEGRYKCQRLLDDAAVLACSVYVDLNPIRAGAAETPETSRNTSAYERIHADQPVAGPPSVAAAGTAAARQAAGTRRRRIRPWPRDRWLSPVELSASRASCSRAPAHRASDLGYLPMTLQQYLELLDWTGRQVRRDKRGVIPGELATILQRLGVGDETWVDMVVHFGRWFHRVAGRAESLAAEASRRGLRWMQGVAHSRSAFA